MSVPVETGRWRTIRTAAAQCATPEPDKSSPEMASTRISVKPAVSEPLQARSERVPSRHWSQFQVTDAQPQSSPYSGLDRYQQDIAAPQDMKTEARDCVG